MLIQKEQYQNEGMWRARRQVSQLCRNISVWYTISIYLNSTEDYGTIKSEGGGFGWIRKRRLGTLLM